MLCLKARRCCPWQLGGLWLVLQPVFEYGHTIRGRYFMWKEFREFAMKGNALDLAIGVMIGGAFSKIVTSIVNDILMPPVGLLLGKMDFSNLYLNLSNKDFDSLAAAKQAGAPTINYGLFLNNVLDFLIVALVLFFLVRQMNRLRRKFEAAEAPAAPPAAPDTKPCPYCLSGIPAKATRCAHCTSAL